MGSFVEGSQISKNKKIMVLPNDKNSDQYRGSKRGEADRLARQRTMDALRLRELEARRRRRDSAVWRQKGPKGHATAITNEAIKQRKSPDISKKDLTRNHRQSRLR